MQRCEVTCQGHSARRRLSRLWLVSRCPGYRPPPTPGGLPVTCTEGDGGQAQPGLPSAFQCLCSRHSRVQPPGWRILCVKLPLAENGVSHLTRRERHGCPHQRALPLGQGTLHPSHHTHTPLPPGINVQMGATCPLRRQLSEQGTIMGKKENRKNAFTTSDV